MRLLNFYLRIPLPNPQNWTPKPAIRRLGDTRHNAIDVAIAETRFSKVVKLVFGDNLFAFAKAIITYLETIHANSSQEE
jgi:hypothetical protein